MCGHQSYVCYTAQVLELKSIHFWWSYMHGCVCCHVPYDVCPLILYLEIGNDDPQFFCDNSLVYSVDMTTRVVEYSIYRWCMFWNVPKAVNNAISRHIEK